MKTSESKTNTTPAKTGSPFFQRSEGGVMPAAQTAPAFFQKGSSIQAKLNIGEPDDKYEKEADATAGKVLQRLNNNAPKNTTIGNDASSQVSSISPITSFAQTKPLSSTEDEKLQKKEKEDDKEQLKQKLQRKPIFESNAEPPPDKEKEVQRKSSESSSGMTASPSMESQLSASKGSGSALPSQTQQEMESSFGTDFSQVRIHNNNTAAQMSEGIDAQAFTHGNDIYFNSGKYDTSSQEGKHLLAHELTHTVQQGGIKRKQNDTPGIQRANVPKPVPVSSEVVNIASGQFTPSEKLKAEITAAGNAGLDVRVIVPGIAREGTVRVYANKKGEIKMVSGQNGYMPLNNAWADQLGGLFLVFNLENDAITDGYVSVKQKKDKKKGGWLEVIKQNSSLLGGLGLKIPKIPEFTNTFSGNTYQLGVKDMKVEVGGFLDANFSITLENMTAPKIAAQADVNVKGVVKGQFKMDNTKGKLTGEVMLGVDYKNFNGSVTVTYKEDGSIDIHGKAAYNSDKLSGEIDFVSTDLESANSFAKDAIKAAGGVEKSKEVTEPPAMPAPKPAVKERALAAVGKLQFNLTEWFAGTVNVIVDGKGAVTVIGKIAPPGEIILFNQKDFDKELVHLQVEAGYGIPVIGTVGVFAGVILSAVAYIGPAKLYNIEIDGTYSTDPEIQKSIQISASLNISAYAGLRLRAEGGFKLTILSHDLKIGVGVNADVGVKAYVDARPTIGYRDPGQFYVSGTLDMIAQPMLGLSGDFFIELDTPWWSPLSDDKWVWPIFSKEWPLTDPIGLSATMKDYVLGSGVAPDIEFKKPEFDPSKFMTAMVDKQLPDKAGADKGGQGGFKDDGSVPPPQVAPADGAKKEGEADPKVKGGPAGKVGTQKPPPTPEDQKAAGEIFKLSAPKLEGIKGPISKADLKKQLGDIEHTVKGIHYNIKLNGSDWTVVPEAKGIESKPIHFAAIVTEEDKKAETTDKIESALTEIDTEGKQKIADGEVTSEDAHQIAEDVKRDHPTVIQSISVVDGGETWDYQYVQRTNKKSIPKKNTRFINSLDTVVSHTGDLSKASPLTKKKGGSASTIDIPGWDHAAKLNLAKDPLNNGRGGDWVKGHKISYRLGGPGNDAENLFIIDRSANGLMSKVENDVEAELKRLIKLTDTKDEDYDKVMFYENKHSLHGSSGILSAFGHKIDLHWGTMKPDGSGRSVKDSIPIVSAKPSEDAGEVKYSVNNTGWETFWEVTGKVLLQKFVKELMRIRNIEDGGEVGKYQTYDDMSTKVLSLNDKEIPETKIKEQLRLLRKIINNNLEFIAK